MQVVATLSKGTGVQKKLRTEKHSKTQSRKLNAIFLIRKFKKSLIEKQAYGTL